MSTCGSTVMPSQEQNIKVPHPLCLTAECQDSSDVPAKLVQGGWPSQTHAYHALHPRDGLQQASCDGSASDFAQGIDARAPMQPVPHALLAENKLNISVIECNPAKDVQPTGRHHIAAVPGQRCFESFDSDGCYAGT